MNYCEIRRHAKRMTIVIGAVALTACAQTFNDEVLPPPPSIIAADDAATPNAETLAAAAPDAAAPAADLAGRRDPAPPPPPRPSRVVIPSTAPASAQPSGEALLSPFYGDWQGGWNAGAASDDAPSVQQRLRVLDVDGANASVVYEYIRSDGDSDRSYYDARIDEFVLTFQTSDGDRLAYALNEDGSLSSEWAPDQGETISGQVSRAGDVAPVRDGGSERFVGTWRALNADGWNLTIYDPVDDQVTVFSEWSAYSDPAGRRVEGGSFIADGVIDGDQLTFAGPETNQVRSAELKADNLMRVVVTPPSDAAAPSDPAAPSGATEGADLVLERDG